MEEDSSFANASESAFLSDDIYIYVIHDGCYYITLCCCSINTLARLICALPRGARVFFFFDTCSP